MKMLWMKGGRREWGSGPLDNLYFCPWKVKRGLEKETKFSLVFLADFHMKGQQRNVFQDGIKALFISKTMHFQLCTGPVIKWLALGFFCILRTFQRWAAVNASRSGACAQVESKTNSTSLVLQLKSADWTKESKLGINLVQCKMTHL